MFMFRDSLPKMNGNIRFLHSISNAPNVDVYANGRLLYPNLSFGSATSYISIPTETYNIELCEAGTYNTPLISEPIEILPNSESTLIITSKNNKINYFVMDDTHDKSNPLLSFVRFINLVPTAPQLSLILPDDIVFFDKTSYLERNDYYPTSPGTYNFAVCTSDNKLNKAINNVHLTKNLFITIYVLGLYNSNRPLGYILLKDGIKKTMSENI